MQATFFTASQSEEVRPLTDQVGIRLIDDRR